MARLTKAQLQAKLQQLQAKLNSADKKYWMHAVYITGLVVMGAFLIKGCVGNSKNAGTATHQYSLNKCPLDTVNTVCNYDAEKNIYWHEINFDDFCPTYKDTTLYNIQHKDSIVYNIQRRKKYKDEYVKRTVNKTDTVKRVVELIDTVRRTYYVNDTVRNVVRVNSDNNKPSSQSGKASIVNIRVVTSSNDSCR